MIGAISKIFMLTNIMLPFAFGLNGQNFRKNLRGLDTANTSSMYPTVSPSSEPSKDTPTTLPTSPPRSWSVGKTEIKVFGENAFDGKLIVQNDIGLSVDHSKVIVELFDYNCKNSKDSSTLEVSLESNDYISSPYQYNITLHKDKLGSSPGGFVKYEGDTRSKGSIQFCTRVLTYEGDIAVQFRETNILLNFDLTDNQFRLSNMKYDGMEASEFTSAVELGIGVEVCQCDHNFACYSSNDIYSLSQDENLVLCLEPTDSSAVEISNFNLELSAGAFIYQPVTLGLNTWQTDNLTNVSSLGKRIKVSTPIIAHFFMEDYANINVRGTAQLNFGSSDGKTSNVASYDLTVDLNNEKQKDGCLKSIFQTVKSLF